MTDQDLTLLTDEEREAVKWVENTGDGPLAGGAQLFLRSLIAARAENQRKDEALRLALPVLEYIKADGWDEAPPITWPYDEHLALEKVRTALLQSEKGSE